ELSRERGRSDVPVCHYITSANIKPGTDKFIFSHGGAAVRRQDCSVAATLNCAAALIRVCFGVSQRTTGARFHEVVGSGDQTDAAAIFTSQFYGERQT